MPRFEKPEDIRARLRTLDRLVRDAGADPADALDAVDVQRINAVMQRVRAERAAPAGTSRSHRAKGKA